MSSAYIRSLQRTLETEDAPQQLFKPDLKQRFIEWFASVPEISRIGERGELTPAVSRQFEIVARFGSASDLHQFNGWLGPFGVQPLPDKHNPAIGGSLNPPPSTLARR
ncbi:MAG TPA: hypothetical protein VGE05_03755 [Novosphingobium sp.]